MDVGLHLAQRDAERGGDVLIARVLEMEQHERHALVIGQPPERRSSSLALVSRLQLQSARRRANCRPRPRRGIGVITSASSELAEEPPACPVTRQVIETGIRRDGLQPAGRAGLGPIVVEALKRPQEDGLRHILGVGRVAEQPDRGGEHHVLIPPHERLKLVGVGHA